MHWHNVQYAGGLNNPPTVHLINGYFENTSEPSRSLDQRSSDDHVQKALRLFCQRHNRVMISFSTSILEPSLSYNYC
jgi:hypothetical protein